MLSLVGKLGVDLIGDNKQVFLHADLRDLRQIFRLHNGTGRVVRERKHQDFRLRCDLFQEFFFCQAELVLLLKLDRNRNTVRQDRTRSVGHIARLRDQNFISRI